MEELGNSSVSLKEAYALQLALVNNQGREEDGCYELAITNISESLTGLLKSSKKELIGAKLTQIIPEMFVELHRSSFHRFVSSSSFRVEESAFLGDTLELPFRVNDKEVIFFCVSSRLFMDPISNCLTV